MRRVLNVVIALACFGMMTVGVTPSFSPLSPVMASAQTIPPAYPGNKIEFDQPSATAEDAAVITQTVKWDATAKLDLVRTCDSWSGGKQTCRFPIPANTTPGNHTILLTAVATIDGVRYESANSDPFLFVYVVPTAPPVPGGCRIVK